MIEDRTAEGLVVLMVGFVVVVGILLFMNIEVVGDEPNETGFCYQEGTAICFDNSNQDWVWICEVEESGKFCNYGVKAKVG